VSAYGIITYSTLILKKIESGENTFGASKNKFKMTQKFLRISLGLIAFGLFSSYGQSNIKTIELQKGEVF